MAGREKKMIRDTRGGAVYESMYAAGKAIAPDFIAAQLAAGAKGAEKLKNDQHIWFAIARSKDNVGRFEVSTDGGATYQPFVFTPSKRKTAAEKKAADAAKGTNGSTAAAGESKEDRIKRLQAELAAATSAGETSAPTVASTVVEEEESKPTPGAPKLAGTMKVAKA